MDISSHASPSTPYDISYIFLGELLLIDTLYCLLSQESLKTNAFWVFCIARHAQCKGGVGGGRWRFLGYHLGSL